MPAPATFPPAARDALLAWYRAEGRPLAFRRTRDPYAILVSEAMAQQTQAARAAVVLGAIHGPLPDGRATWPPRARPTSCARGRAWATTGAALALWRAAGVIVRDHGGRVPDTVEALDALPGVGPYTARAVAALAFGRPVGAVDVNVRRVLGRMVAGSLDALSPSEVQALADRSVPPDDPGEWTHARHGPRGDRVPAAGAAMRGVPDPSVVPVRGDGSRPRPPMRRADSGRGPAAAVPVDPSLAARPHPRSAARRAGRHLGAPGRADRQPRAGGASRSRPRAMARDGVIELAGRGPLAVARPAQG